MHTEEQQTVQENIEKRLAAVQARKAARRYIGADDERKFAAGLRSKWSSAHATARELGMLMTELDRRTDLLLANRGAGVQRDAELLTPKFREALALVDQLQTELTSLVE